MCDHHPSPVSRITPLVGCGSLRRGQIRINLNEYQLGESHSEMNEG
jgi:hypothetical protein